jgi:hypothetical protein
VIQYDNHFALKFSDVDSTCKDVLAQLWGITANICLLSHDGGCVGVKTAHTFRSSVLHSFTFRCSSRFLALDLASAACESD